MPRIIYLTYDGLTDPLGQSQILPYQIGLQKKGYDITIVSFEKNENKHLRALISEQLKNVGIQWHHIRYSKNPPVFSTIYDLLRLKLLVFRLHKKKSFQIVHCRSYLTALIGLRLKRKKNVKFIFDMRGFWADERIDGGIWRLSNPLYRKIYVFFKRMEKRFLSESDQVISLTYSGKKLIESTIVPNSFAPIHVIPCCVDNDHFTQVKPKNTMTISRQSLGFKATQFILGYVGSIGTWYMLPEMMDFFLHLTQRKNDAVFLFVTKENPNLIYLEAERIGVQKESLMVVSASRNEMPLYVSIFNWSIFFIKPVFSKQASSPTKQGELMSMGIPIVCNNGIGDTDDIVKKYESGICISEFTHNNYLKGISEMETFEVEPIKIRAGSIAYFSLTRGINQYQSAYEACLSSLN